MRRTLDMLERVALPKDQHQARAAERRKAEFEAKKAELEKRWGKYWRDAMRSSYSTSYAGTDWGAKHSRRMKGMKRHRGTPTYVGRMTDHSRLGEDGKRLVKAIQKAMGNFPPYSDIPKVTAVINLSAEWDGPSVELRYDGDKVLDWACDWWDEARHIRDALDDAWNDEYGPNAFMTTYVQSGRAADDFEKEFRDKVAEEFHGKFKEMMRSHLKGTPFKLMEEDVDPFQPTVLLEFKPESFGLKMKEWAPRTVAMLREAT